jgi:hypothetical protein
MPPGEAARFLALWNTGLVVSAVHMIAKAGMTGTLGKIFPTLDNSEETLLGNFTSAEDIGWRRLRPWASRCSCAWPEHAYLTHHGQRKIGGSYEPEWISRVYRLWVKPAGHVQAHRRGATPSCHH